jgi:hypothetical protein
VTDVAEVLRVLNSDADRKLAGPAEPVGSGGSHGVLLRAEEGQGIVPEDVRFNKSMASIYDPDQRLHPRGGADLVSPVAGLSAKIFVAEVECSSFASIHFNEREVVKGTHDEGRVGGRWREGRQVTDTDAILIADLQDLVGHLPAADRGKEARREQREGAECANLSAMSDSTAVEGW